jgi:hypothetical protein
VRVIYTSKGMSKKFGVRVIHRCALSTGKHGVLNTFDGHHGTHSECGPCCTEHGLRRTQFCVSINVWRLAGGTLNITCNFLYCNHQVNRDFLITLYYTVRWLHFLVHDHPVCIICPDMFSMIGYTSYRI